MSAPLLVADSGPLIALARLDLLTIPPRLFGGLLVTATVWQEVTREPREVGMLSRVRPLVDALLASGYYLAQPLIDRTLASVGE